MRDPVWTSRPWPRIGGACEWTVRPVGVVSVIACGPPPGSGPSASKAGRLDPDGEPRGLLVEVVALTDPEAIARGGGSAVCCGEGMVDLADGGIAPRDAADLIAQLDEASQPTRVHALPGGHGDQVASVCPGPELPQPGAGPVVALGGAHGEEVLASLRGGHGPKAGDLDALADAAAAARTTRGVDDRGVHDQSDLDGLGLRGSSSGQQLERRVGLPRPRTALVGRSLGVDDRVTGGGVSGCFGGPERGQRADHLHDGPEDAQSGHAIWCRTGRDVS